MYLGGSSFHEKEFKDLTYWSEQLSVLVTRPILVINMGSPDVSVVKNLTTNAWDMGSIFRPGRSLRVGNGTPLQYSCQENSVDRGAWWVTGHGVTKESEMAMYVCTECKSMFYYLCSKESACNAGDLGLILGLGRSPGARNGNPLQQFCLKNSVDRGA